MRILYLMVRSIKEIELMSKGIEFDKLDYDLKDRSSNRVGEHLLTTVDSLGTGDTLLILSLEKAFQNFHEFIGIAVKLANNGADLQTVDGQFKLSDMLSGRKVLETMQLVFAAWGKSEAPKRGRTEGRPKVTLPPNSDQIIKAFINHSMSVEEAKLMLGVSQGTLYSLVRQYKEKHGIKYEKRG